MKVFALSAAALAVILVGAALTGFVIPWMLAQNSTLLLFAVPVVVLCYLGVLGWCSQRVYISIKKGF